MASPVEAMRAIVSVRWPLLESYALARQDGLVEPVGLVIDQSYAYGKELASQLLLAQVADATVTPSVSCMERGALAGMLAVAAPELAALLRGAADQPGRWIAILLADQGWMLSGTWQELMMAEARGSTRPGQSRAR